jgi:hypothetical protein
MFWQVAFVLGILGLVSHGNDQHNSIVSIKTENNHYFASIYTSLEIQTVYTNTFDYPVYITGCHRISGGIEKLINSTWVFTYPRSIFPCGGIRAQVNPQEALLDTFVIYWNDLYFENPDFSIEGEYRIVWEIYSSPDDETYVNRETLLPLEQRTSNIFRIEPL